MAFRKRNVALGRGVANTSPSAPGAQEKEQLPGVRPSPLTSHPVTSTGAASLDTLLGGHGGLALGSSLLVEESGTTDYAGALLKYYAAEGICHGHVVSVVGMGEGWIRELPGTVEKRNSAAKKEEKTADAHDADRMKIAWRYEGLGKAGERERAGAERTSSQDPSSHQAETPFCHTFDLTKRLPIPQGAQVHHLQIDFGPNPFEKILSNLTQALKTSTPNTIHRFILPNLLSPALYPPSASQPQILLRFLRSLRSLLRQYPARLAAMISLPQDLYPRTSALVRWAELLVDGALELTPFPHLASTLAESGGATKGEEQPQGLVKVHKLPLTTERGEGGAGAGNSLGDDLAFTLSRRNFVIKEFALPPAEGDQEAQKEGTGVSGKDVEF